MPIIGTKLFAWGSALTAGPIHCGSCGSVAQFVQKTAMRLVTLFFVIPVIPISKKMLPMECQRCKTRYERQA